MAILGNVQKGRNIPFSKHNSRISGPKEFARLKFHMISRVRLSLQVSRGFKQSRILGYQICENRLFTSLPDDRISFTNSLGDSGSFQTSICKGCGSKAQTADPSVPGYLPESILSTFNGGWRRRVRHPGVVASRGSPEYADITKCNRSSALSKSTMLYCQRCFTIQQYHRDPRFAVISRAAGDSRHTETATVFNSLSKVISEIPPDALVIKLIDVLDLETSLVPEVYEALASREIPVITVVNKMDCLPIDKSSWVNVVKSINLFVKHLRSGLPRMDERNLLPVSAMSGEGFGALEKRLEVYMTSKNPRDIYVVGRQTSGKSTFVNRFVQFVRVGQLGCVHNKRRVGGITQSPIPGTTRGFLPVSLGRRFRIVDTPGIPSFERIQRHFSHSQDFYDAQPGKKLQPLTLGLREGKSLLLGAMCKVEVSSGASVQVTSFVSPKVTVHICKKNNVDDLLNRKGGSFLYPPHVDSAADCGHEIVRKTWVKHSIRLLANPSVSRDDVSIAGLGWISVYGHGPKEIDVWVPEGVKVFRRPALLPDFIRSRGSTAFSFRQRGRSQAINRRKKMLVQSAMSTQRKGDWRDTTAQNEEEYSSPLANDPAPQFVGIETHSAYIIS